MGAGLAKDAATCPPVPMGPAAAEIPPAEIPVISDTFDLGDLHGLTTNGDVSPPRKRLDSFIRVEHNDDLCQI